jgi:type IV pilus assembly protein PilA
MEATRSTRILAAVRQAIARRAEEAEEGAESGFTLIELMVVLLIMAILLAIAIPTFLGVKGGAQDRSAQSDLTNAITAAKAYYANNGSYTAVATLVSAMQSNEPELSWGTGPALTSPAHEISVAVSTDNNILVLATESASKTCWYAEDNDEPSATTGGLTGATSTQGVQYAEGTAGQAPSTGCTATLTAAPASGWQASYP